MMRPRKSLASRLFVGQNDDLGDGLRNRPTKPLCNISTERTGVGRHRIFDGFLTESLIDRGKQKPLLHITFNSVCYYYTLSYI